MNSQERKSSILQHFRQLQSLKTVPIETCIPNGPFFNSAMWKYRTKSRPILEWLDPSVVLWGVFILSHSLRRSLSNRISKSCYPSSTLQGLSFSISFNRSIAPAQEGVQGKWGGSARSARFKHALEVLHADVLQMVHEYCRFPYLLQ